MILIGVVTLSAVRSIWWAIVPMLAGWVIWLATEEVLVAVRHPAVALGRPAGGADHRADDARGQPPGDPLPRRPPPRGRPAPGRALDAGLRRRADRLDGDHRRHRLRGARHQRASMPVRQFGAILGTCTLGAAMLVMLISPIAMLPPFRLEVPVRYGSRSRVAAAMNRLIAWVHRHPGAIVAAVAAVVLPVSAGLVRAQLRDQLHQPVPPRDPRRRRLPRGRVAARRDRRGRARRARWTARSRPRPWRS